MKLPETRDHGWINVAGQPRSMPPPARRLGRGKSLDKGKADAKPMPVPGVLDLQRLAHSGCVDHVRVKGLRSKVCIQRGADRDAVIAEARELAGVE